MRMKNPSTKITGGAAFDFLGALKGFASKMMKRKASNPLESCLIFLVPQKKTALHYAVP